MTAMVEPLFFGLTSLNLPLLMAVTASSLQLLQENKLLSPLAQPNLVLQL